MRENQVGTEIEGGIMIIGVEIMTGIVIKNVIGIMTALRLMILEVAIGHILGLGNAPRIMIATGILFNNIPCLFDNILLVLFCDHFLTY
ncbi:hypothetical protein SLEP1_g51951 [Rubroshorea leprosula]|nr:hypothetical protein SLEP1_g51951 [Rubroshorea leprosula]